MSVLHVMAIHPIVVETPNQNLQPHGGVRGKVRGSPKSIGVDVWRL